MAKGRSEASSQSLRQQGHCYPWTPVHCGRASRKSCSNTIRDPTALQRNFRDVNHKQVSKSNTLRERFLCWPLCCCDLPIHEYSICFNSEMKKMKYTVLGAHRSQALITTLQEIKDYSELFYKTYISNLLKMKGFSNSNINPSPKDILWEATHTQPYFASHSAAALLSVDWCLLSVSVGSSLFSRA